MRGERVTFIGFTVLDEETLAGLRSMDYIDEILWLNRTSCEIRLRNLASMGLAYDETIKAVREFANLERVFDEGECLCPIYAAHYDKCGSVGCDCHEVTRSDVL